MSTDTIAFCIIMLGVLVLAGVMIAPLLREDVDVGPPWSPDAFLAPLDVRRFAKVYANKGEAVVCDGPGQHVIGIFRQTVYRGDQQDSALLEWRQTPPNKGAAAKSCTCIRRRGGLQVASACGKIDSILRQ